MTDAHINETGNLELVDNRRLDGDRPRQLADLGRGNGLLVTGPEAVFHLVDSTIKKRAHAFIRSRLLSKKSVRRYAASTALGI